MLTRRRRSALDTAETELTLIASVAVMGDSSKLACRIYLGSCQDEASSLS